MNVIEDIIIQVSAHSDKEAINAELNAWQQANKVARLWAHDATLWTNSDENEWLGWLNVAEENSDISRIEALANDIKVDNINDIVLMGMGGSSLCPVMMAQTFGKRDAYPSLHILDSTDPLQIRHLEDRINLKKTFFIISSKSGSTLEPNIFKDYFYTRLQTVLNKTDVGDHFLAITDPGTSLEKMAKSENFTAVFHGVPSIGGRYSALSNFGMVPLGLMGVNVKVFLQNIKSMQQACSPTTLTKDNPAVVLGVVLGVCAKYGKNKVTLITSPAIDSLGAWLEQLLAESTGKNGTGFIPVDQEKIGAPSVYGNDRVFVYIRLESAPDADQDRLIDVLAEAGFVVIWLSISDIMHLGAELFRWEMATAVAGSILGINPFNQPDVEASKILTAQLTDQYEKTEQLTMPPPFFTEDGLSLFTDEKNLTDLNKHLIDKPSMIYYLHAHLSRVQPGDYVDLSAFIEMSAEHIALLQESRILIRDHKQVATCLGFGPRFLHSTGQAYKGGSNTGLFLQITADHDEDIQIPGHRYSFGIVITAQAQGDFAVLLQRSRRVLRIHLGKDVQGGLQRLRALILMALRTEY